MDLLMMNFVIMRTLINQHTIASGYAVPMNYFVDLARKSKKNGLF